jgi:hypothetical protein
VTAVDPNLHDRFILSQHFRPIVNQYEVSTLGSDEQSAGEPVCFVEQKRMKLKEDLRAFTDDSKTTELFGSRRCRGLILARGTRSPTRPERGLASSQRCSASP